MPNDRAVLDFMPGANIPVIRQTFQPGDLLPYWVHPRVDEHHLYNIDIDPSEEENRLGKQDEKDMLELLSEGLRAVNAPGEQFQRLGLG